MQGDQHRFISHAQKVFREEDQQLLSLVVQRVHRPKSQLRHHVLTLAQPSVYQIQGSTNQFVSSKKSLRDMLPIGARVLNRANKVELVYR